MSEMTAKAALPACPVETTLTLIGDKWKVLILRDRQCVPKGLDRPTPGNGGKQACSP